MALHEHAVGKSDEWYTPPEIFEALGCVFDIDVASPGRHITPWLPANYFITEGSLGRAWHGFAWMNPPFGGRNALTPWLAKFFAHGDGIALVPDRTSAPWWQTYAPRADLVLFVAHKVQFIAGFDDPSTGIARGAPGKSPAQGTTLLGCGSRAQNALEHAARRGFGSLFTARLPHAR